MGVIHAKTPNLDRPREDDQPSQLKSEQITEATITDSSTGERNLPLFSTISLKKKKRRMLFANQLSKHALFNTGAPVNYMTDSEYIGCKRRHRNTNQTYTNRV